MAKTTREINSLVATFTTTIIRRKEGSNRKENWRNKTGRDKGTVAKKIKRIQKKMVETKSERKTTGGKWKNWEKEEKNSQGCLATTGGRTERIKSNIYKSKNIIEYENITTDIRYIWII